jgi:hypothetical protein
MMKKLIVVLLVFGVCGTLIAKRPSWEKRCLWTGKAGNWYMVYGGIGIPILDEQGEIMKCPYK